MPPAADVHTGVGAVVRRQISGVTNILLVQRGGEGKFASDGYGMWALPGGWIEFGETAGEAAVREVAEECGLTVDQGRDDGFVTGISDDGSFHIVTLFHECEYRGGVVRNAEPDKALDVRWMPEDLLVEFDLFAPLDRWWRRPRDEIARMEAAWRAKCDALADDSREHQECRRIFREGYMPRIPGENASIKGRALAELADILLDR